MDDPASLEQCVQNFEVVCKGLDALGVTFKQSVIGKVIQGNRGAGMCLERGACVCVRVCGWVCVGVTFKQSVIGKVIQGNRGAGM